MIKGTPRSSLFSSQQGPQQRATRRPPGTQSSGIPSVPEVAAPSRRRLVVLLVILVLVTVSGAAYWGVTLYQDAHPTAAPTTLMASPTPTVSPVERPFQTSFTAALPESVLQYALASSVENTDWLGRGAIEAYTEEFDDGAGGALVVSEGQWATSAQALDVLADLTVTSTSADAANHPQMGPVNVNGANAGRYILAINDDDTETITWTNGSAVLQLTGPPTEVTRAFSAFTI